MSDDLVPARLLRLPRFPARDDRGGFPVASAIAPVVAAAVIWAVTRSPYALLFAAAAPLAAVGALLDRRWRGRRRRRRELSAAREALRTLADRVASLGDRRRAELRRGVCDPRTLRSGVLETAWRGGRPRILWGTGRLPSGLDLGEPDEAPPELRGEVAELVGRAARVDDAPVVTDAVDVGVVGAPVIAAGAARSIAIQLCAQLDPAETSVRTLLDEPWLTALPHRLERVGAETTIEFRSAESVHRVAWADRPEALPTGVRAVLETGEPFALRVDGVLVEVEGLRPVLVSCGTAGEIAERLRAASRSTAATSVLPESVALAGVSEHPTEGRTLATVLGVGTAGPLWVDLVADGPHAVIGGTTGSGKSELLVAWIAGLAERYPPERVAFLLIDFKGGSSFAQLAGLPHVVGVVSDLDASLARRATASLRAEVLRRERLLAERGLRDMAECTDQPRLVVVIDEYAALVADQPELHELIADLAARGRSLGIHLLMCTQRPAGVIRDQVLANAGLRICLRVTNRADSIAVVGDAAASELGGAPPGRAIVVGADGVGIPMQAAMATAADLQRIRGLRTGSAAAFRPWAEPLPSSIRLSDLDGEGPGAAFGLVDLPEHQRVDAARFDPGRDGNLLVVGGRGSGTTTALATIASGLGDRVVVVPSNAADAWAVLRDVLDGGASPGASSAVVVLDDADLVLDGADEDVRAGLTRLLAALARELPARGGALVLGASRALVGATALMTRIDGRLLLALPDRESHVVAGGAAADWVARRPPGRGIWHGREVQVAIPERMPVSAVPATPELAVDERALAIAAGRPDRVRRALGSHTPVVPALWTGSEPGLGDPEEWAAAWQQVEAARRSGALLLVDATPADLRLLTRTRQDPPPLGPGRAEGWLVHEREVARVRLPWLEAR